MKFQGFEIHANPFITNAYCQCNESLIMVSNGWLSSVMFCPKCKFVYALKLVKVPANKISNKFIKQAINEAQKKKL